MDVLEEDRPLREPSQKIAAAVQSRQKKGYISHCVRIVRIVRKVVLIFAHKKNRTKNKALCGSFVRIFCSF